MVAKTEADWELRLWHLTHDLVVRMAMENADAEVPAVEAAIECLELASAAVNTYRAVVERATGGAA